MIEVVGNGGSTKASFVCDVADLGGVVGTNEILGTLPMCRGSVTEMTKGKNNISNGYWQIQRRRDGVVRMGASKINRLLRLKPKRNAHPHNYLSLNHP